MKTLNPIRYAWIFLLVSEIVFLVLYIQDQYESINLTDILSGFYILSIIFILLLSIPVSKQKKGAKVQKNGQSTLSTATNPIINNSTQEPLFLKSPSDKMVEKLEAQEKAQSMAVFTNQGSKGTTINTNSLSNENKVATQSAIVLDPNKSVKRSTLLGSNLSGSLPLSLEIIAFEDYVQEDVVHVRYVIKVVRTNGITLAKRRCSEFRQLIAALKTEMPKMYFPELPPKKSTGSNLPLQEKRDILQNVLDYFLALKIYNKELHKFLSREHEVPVYLKKISKRATKKGKILIPAAPSPSLLVPSDDPKIRESLIEVEEINMDTLQQRYTTKYESTFESVSSVGGSLKQSESSTIKNESSIRTSEYSAKESEINLEQLKTGLMDAMTFMVRITDIKLQANKFYYTICISCSIACGDQTIRTTHEALRVFHKDVVLSKYKKLGLEFPNNPRSDGHREKMQEYIGSILGTKKLREEEEVKRIFKLKQFYEQAEREEKLYEAINIPE